MNLVGETVRHRMMGNGTVVEQADGLLIVEFSRKTSKFSYNKDTFTKFLALEDSDAQALLLKEFEEIRLAEEKMKQEEQAKQLAEKEQKTVAVSVEKEHAKLPPKRTLVKQERIPGKRMTFYVFQGSTFDRESRGGYIWAPIRNKDGKTMHHWDRLLDVQPGDIIFHGYNAHVQAISVARDRCYECNQPEELRTEHLWDQEGRRVDCDYIILKQPIRTADYVEDIKRFCNVKYAPFDRNGSGNMGYLYDLNRELAKIFSSDIVKLNPVLKTVDYIVELLSEK